MYAKIFRSLWDGSLRGMPNKQLVLIYLLAHADEDGVVEVIHSKIADDTGLTNEQVVDATSSLEEPDDDSRSADEDGRVIVPLHEHRTWGWRIVNYAKYRDIRRKVDRMEQNREAQRRQRMSAPVSKRQLPSAKSAKVEVEVEAEAYAKQESQPLPDQFIDRVLKPLISSGESNSKSDRNSDLESKPTPTFREESERQKILAEIKRQKEAAGVE